MSGLRFENARVHEDVVHETTSRYIRYAEYDLGSGKATKFEPTAAKETFFVRTHSVQPFIILHFLIL